MTTAYFHPLGRTADSARFHADPATGGPWAHHLQHGGPPNALMVAEAERCAREATGRSDLVALRLAAEFVGPVPVAEVSVTTRVLRAARVAVLVQVAVHAAGRECLTGRIWLVRDADTSQIAAPESPADGPAGDLPGLGAGFPYGDSVDWRVVSGGLRIPGPGAAWARTRMPVVEATAVSGLQLAALVGDSASGLSSALDWSVWSFLNVDLDIHLARPVRGEWLHLAAETQLGPNGSALARSTLSDLAGPVGSTAQTLVLEPIRT